MKIWPILIIMCLPLSQAWSQTRAKSIHFKEIKVGDPMPDLSLDEAQNNQTGKTRLSQFKGKLVILDFWDSWCAPCIKEFPEMSQLQRTFGDKIQIILVNYLENAEQLKARSQKLGKALIMPENLISLVDAKSLMELFPPKAGIGYHVWIDPKGTVCLRGPGILNTHEEKIQEFLAGKDIDFIKDGDPFDPKKPLYSVAEKTASSIPKYNSFFSNFNDDLGEAWGNNLTNIGDSISHTVRNTFTNTQALDLFEYAVKPVIRDSNVLWGRRITLLVNDTTRYTDNPSIVAGQKTDKTQRKCRFCYEQVTPDSLSEDIRLQYMLSDLNRYFGIMYGAQGTVEKRTMACWELIRTSQKDNIQTVGGPESSEIISQQGVNMVQYSNYTFRQIFESILLSRTKLFSDNDIILDGTNYNGKVDLLLPDPHQLQNIEDLRKALQRYGLDIIKAKKEIRMLTIRESTHQSLSNR